MTGAYIVPPVWLLPDLTARPATSGRVWRISRERRHAVDGDCWCGEVHVAMAGLTLGMLAEFREHERRKGTWRADT